MPALWHTGLLLSLLSHCACLEEECVVGIVGQPVSVPCFYDGLQVDSFNVSIEWRREDEVVLRAVWGEAGRVEIWGMSDTNGTTVSSNAPQTGNFSLELSNVDHKQPKTYYRLFIISGEEHSPPLCTVCLRIAASFSYPLLQREAAAEGDQTDFVCRSSGGFPEPAVYWLIDDTEEPPSGSVRTLTAQLPDSPLYNITSHLTVNISQDSSVSCIIENLSINETLISTSYGVLISPVVSRATEAMWIFSTALCVVVGFMVLLALAYQIHLDRTHKKHYHIDQGYKGCPADKEETAVMELELVDSLTETNV